MAQNKGLLDGLPPWLRHLGMVTVFAFLGSVINAVLANNGVSNLDWGATLVSALDLAGVALAGAALVLIGTPVTRQYGVGSGS